VGRVILKTPVATHAILFWPANLVIIAKDTVLAAASPEATGTGGLA
jgi:hypothetical protein